MTFVYLDLETTGLDPLIHDIWEIGYAVDDGDITTAVIRHDTINADPVSLEMAGDRRLHPVPYRKEHTFMDSLWEALNEATVVAANPSFDTAFLRYAFKKSPWHYRLLDIEVYAMPMLGADKPLGLHTICKRLEIENSAPHTAAGDIDAVRKVHKVLRTEYASKLWLSV